MIALTLGEIARAVSGRLTTEGTSATESTVVAGPVQTDSREPLADGVFVAKPGETTDGHRFVPAAVAAGAAVAIVEHPVAAAVAQIVVADAVTALGDLAREVVARVRARGVLRIVAITGSNGKTTTKNMLAAILARDAETVAAKASFNNEVGAPLTMLRLTDETRYLVAEMGASDVGEIARLVRLAHPDVGVVLAVGLAHAGIFGSIEATARAKSEMVTDLEAHDTAVLNRDDPRVWGMAGLTRARVVSFGFGPEAQVRAADVTASIEGTAFTLGIGTGAEVESRHVHLRILGEHHVSNALAAATAAHRLGIDIDTIVAGLESLERAERGRMEVLGGRDGVTIINDAYNASPDSMAAALKTLALLAGPGRRTIAVLGEMAELGDLSGPEHDRIGLIAVRLGLDQVVAVGPGARRLHLSTVNEGSWNGESIYVETLDAAYDLIVRTARTGDIVLVKSSNASGLLELGDRLGDAFS